MFRKYISFLFVAAILLQAFNKPLFMLAYYANPSAYAKSCINKTRPKMHCNGKCQMMKQMNDEEKKDQKEETRKIEFNTDVLPSKLSGYDLSKLQEEINCNYTSYYMDVKPTSMPRAVFHPPSTPLPNLI